MTNSSIYICTYYAYSHSQGFFFLNIVFYINIYYKYNKIIVLWWIDPSESRKTYWWRCIYMGLSRIDRFRGLEGPDPPWVL